MTMEYKCGKEKLIMYFIMENGFGQKFDYVNIRHIRQLKNQEADDLAQIGFGYKVSK